MKVVIITAPMMKKLDEKHYPVDGNKSIEFDKPVRCPINGILAKTLQKDEKVNIIYISIKDNNRCENNKNAFIDELKNINKEIGAILNFDAIYIPFEPTKQTYNTLITELAEKIPENSEIFTDITYSFKPAILSLFCALRFVEEFKNAIIQYIVYGKVEFDDNNVPQNPMLYDITSLYYLFKLMGSMGATDAKTATETLKEFFAV